MADLLPENEYLRQHLHKNRTFHKGNYEPATPSHRSARYRRSHHRVGSFHRAHVYPQRAHPASVQRTHDRWSRIRLLRGRIPNLGSGVRRTLSLARISVSYRLSFCRHRMGAPCGMGHPAPPLRKTDPSLCPSLIFWLRNLRHRHCHLVLLGSALCIPTKQHGTTSHPLSDRALIAPRQPSQRAHRASSALGGQLQTSWLQRQLSRSHEFKKNTSEADMQELIAAHQCRNCSGVFTSTRLNEDATATGVVVCPRCAYASPLHIVIVSKNALTN